MYVTFMVENLFMVLRSELAFCKDAGNGSNNNALTRTACYSVQNVPSAVIHIIYNENLLVWMASTSFGKSRIGHSLK